MKKRNEDLLAELHRHYEGCRDAIRKSLDDFSRVKPSEYFYEMAYCILTPQSSAKSAGKAVERLQEKNFYEESIDPEPALFQKDYYVRFHKTKARLLLELKRAFPEILSALSNGEPGVALREWLVEHVKGLGYKEASHFLRNIGYRDLAILDRHILRNLKRFGAIRSIPKSLTRKQYMRFEKKFRQFAAVAGIPLDELDLLFWSLETGEILK